MDKQTLIDKLRRIEALYAGAATSGERLAAEGARDRIRERLRAIRAQGAAIEFRFSIPDLWSRKLFTALLRRYDLKPYRYRGQRRGTVMVRVPKDFADQTLWPEFCELNRTLHSYLVGVTERVIREEIFSDSSEAKEENPPSTLAVASEEPVSDSEPGMPR